MGHVVTSQGFSLMAELAAVKKIEERCRAVVSQYFLRSYYVVAFMEQWDEIQAKGARCGMDAQAEVGVTVQDCLRHLRVCAHLVRVAAHAGRSETETV